MLAAPRLAMLHAALATAPDRPMVHVAAVTAGIALTGATLVFAAGMIAAPDEPPARYAAALPAAVLSVPPAAPVATPPAALPAGPEPLTLVFRAGGASYLSLADLPDGDDHADTLDMPPHGVLRRSHDRDGVTAAIATVDERDVPAAYQRWLGRRVEVDEVCTATVVELAVVARRASAHGRAGAQRTDAVLRAGHAVLAARLDGCIGSFARDASPDLAPL
jgi:hypothetical protein